MSRHDPGPRIVRCAADWSSVSLPLVLFLAGRFTYRGADGWRERILSGEITVNGAKVPPEYPLAMHDVIEYRPEDLVEPEADLNYRIAYEDEALLIVDKPGNLCIHPSGPFFKHTLWYLLTAEYGEIHLLSRLDRETSGLLAVAKEKSVARRMSRLRAVKEYLAVVHGSFDRETNAAGWLIADTASAVRKKRRFVTALPEGAIQPESAATRLVPERFGNGFSLVRAFPETGRMHQIRATLLSLGFPVAGDKLYGPDELCYLKLRRDELTDADRALLRISRQALHSARLTLTHPLSGRELRIESPLPAEVASLLS